MKIKKHTNNAILTAAFALTAICGSTHAATVLNATDVSGGHYFIDEIPTIAELHTVYNTRIFGKNYPTYNQWSFGFLKFDLSGQTEEVQQAVLKLIIERTRGAKTGPGATIEVFALTSAYLDEDGLFDGDFRDFVGDDGDPTYSDGDYTIGEYYTEHNGYPAEATAWYNSQFGEGVTPLTTVTTNGFEMYDYGTADITDLVNDWISGEKENYGLGFLLAGPDATSINFDYSNAVQPDLTPTLTLVPEPNSALIVGLLSGILIMVSRRRKA